MRLRQKEFFYGFVEGGLETAIGPNEVAELVHQASLDLSFIVPLGGKVNQPCVYALCIVELHGTISHNYVKASE